MNTVRQDYKKFRWDMRDLFIGRRMRSRLTNSNFTLISSDCTGGMLYHDLKQRFNSPTINMFFMAEDYLKFCNNLRYYIDLPMVEVSQKEYDYPVAKIGDVTVHLVHYKSVAEAQEKWNERKARINWNNMFFIMNDRNSCNQEHLLSFDSLNVAHKIVFTHIPHPEIKSSYYIKGFEKWDFVDTMTRFATPISIKRNMDQFDFVKWLNSNQ